MEPSQVSNVSNDKPNRQKANRFTGNRAYFRKHADWIRQYRWYLAGAATLIPVLVMAGYSVAPNSTSYMHSHGELANPHAAWEHKCDACHKQQSWGEHKGGLLDAESRWHDMTCEKCHQGAAHNANISAAGTDYHNRCSNCHHDHAGRTNSLVRIDDEHCTKCHSDLNTWAKSGKPKCDGMVTNFASKHPDFRPLKETKPTDRTLKFNHGVHMSPGQAYTPNGKEAVTVAKLREWSPALAERYIKPGQAADAVINLTCASCHEQDPGVRNADFNKLRDELSFRGEPTHAVLPVRPAGANFLPIDFEAHCRVCHPLNAPTGAVKAQGNSEQTYMISGFSVPHRRQPDQLERDLGAGYLASLVAQKQPAMKAPPGPGGPLDPLPKFDAGTLRDEVGRLTADARKRLLTPGGNVTINKSEGCAKCHDIKDNKVPQVADRTVWFQAAKFNHLAHRATDCMQCHPGTKAAPHPDFKAEDNYESPSATILGIALCQSCHAPAGTKVKLPDSSQEIRGGGIRYSCVDCHKYHNGDHGLQGRAAAAMLPPPNELLTLPEFLNGRKPKAKE